MADEIRALKRCAAEPTVEADAKMSAIIAWLELNSIVVTQIKQLKPELFQRDTGVESMNK